TIGAAIGRAPAAAELGARLRARVDTVRGSITAAPRPRTLVVVWTDPLTVAGGRSFVDDAIVAAGGENIAADSPQPYPHSAVARPLSPAPEVLVAGATPGMPPPLAPLERHTTLPAVRLHRLYTVDADLLFRPGPRLVDGIEALARLLHP